ncbi:hypothetical protein AAFC00_004316 [Neodothiora populina]|uniref:Glycerate dehydrogenase n=1 Tax=Neodothiora populina TaxID=2781224 RepID=A0ABR3PJB2_9PEZI
MATQGVQNAEAGGFVHHIVVLDGTSATIPPPSFPHTITRYRSTSASEIASRLQDATIVIGTGTRLSYDTLKTCGPKLQLCASLGVGVDNFDLEAIRERGLTLVHVPAQNTQTVVEHAFALLGAVKRNLMGLHGFVVGGGKWVDAIAAVAQFARPPKTNSQEILGVIGYGALGQRTEKMAKALGMQVLIAERKGAPAREGRSTFEDVLSQSTVVILTCPLSPSTRNMIDAAELRTMREDVIIVNVGRGGIINELALADALREHRIGGAAVDVFETEPATPENCPLLDPSIPNLLLSPHLAWYSSGTLKGTLEVTCKNMEAFVAGKPQNVIVGPSSPSS